MKLAMLTADWPPIEGGIATLCTGLAAQLTRQMNDVTVLAPARPGSDRHEITGSLAVERWRGYDLGPARVLPLAWQARRHLRRANAALAMNLGQGALVAAVARLHQGPPFVAWTYGYDVQKALRGPFRLLHVWALRRAFAVVAISRYTHALVARLLGSGQRLRLVPPGIDATIPASSLAPGEVRARLGLGPGRIVLTVARLVSRKGHRELAEALALLRRDRSDVVWVVAGRGPESPSLDQRARELGLGPAFAPLGYVPPDLLDALYREASLFALTPHETDTDAEGFGLVFLEAGARGVPVVAGRSGGVLDAVSDEGNGLLVDPADPRAIAGAMRRILDDRALAARLAEGGRAVAAAHDWKRVGARVQAILDEAVR